jgi:hypothetical protein
MAKSILSFEEFSSQIKTKQVEELETTDALEESCGTCDEEPCVCETTGQEEDELEEDDFEDESDDDDDSDEDDDDDDNDDDDDDSDEDDGDDDDDDDDDVEDKKIASQLLKEVYEAACSEACAYEGDDYTEHTVESYIKEMSSLNAGMMAEMYEAACSEVKESDMTIETYEAACNEMKESFCNRIDEMKESWSAK